ncbi:Asp23/Gls24 family envelope stress response protein [Streptomyces reniochalinae]|uniref:Asp23/Gls24 family envelope stress response protein n=1 Tax=Streptomyces reniochalinae TaxID=2250578 RepID=A0A367EB94_9ACTN|nr:Asp23/Gls24 family envelope stress response protein [Streptomyces reniochalinae]RCG15301.1 Asp23/Gls24 family envelope stress response protein [Streptomyces reniochalinae]
MTGDEREQRVAAAAAAALQVQGVAFLKPGLAGRLRASASALARTGRGPDRRRTDPAAGVRVRQGTPWTAEVHIVLQRGHRALDVTRAVRSAVADSFGETPVRVTVTVSGMV